MLLLFDKDALQIESVLPCLDACDTLTGLNENISVWSALVTPYATMHIIASIDI